MKHIISIFISILICGCVARGFIDENRRNMGRLSVGMSKDEVYSVMGTRQESGYGNPYKTEMLKIENKVVEVLYYWTDGNRGDGIQQNELTPVVLVDGRVFGWGQNILSEAVK